MSDLASHPVILIEEIPARTTPAQAVSLLINAAVGAGVLSLPYAFELAGWAGGILLLSSVAAIESYTLYILSRWAESTGASSYGQLVHRSLGRNWSSALSLVLFLYLFGSSVAYLVILGDSFHPLLHHFFGKSWWTGRHATVAIFGTLFVFPLCFPETIASAAEISTVNFVSFIAVIVAIVFRSFQVLAGQSEPFQGVHAFSPSLFRAIPIAVFSLQCHAQVVAVFNELTDGAASENGGDVGSTGSTLRSDSFFAWATRGLRRKQPSWKLTTMTAIIIRSITITAAGYSIVGLAAYLAFPLSMKSNVLNTFSPKDPVIQAARAIVGILEIASYPVNHFPARAAIKDFVRGTTGWELAGSRFVAMETTLFYLASLGFALLIRDLGVVFTLVGGTCGSIIILGLPGLLLMRYSTDKHNKSKRHRQRQTEERDVSTLADSLLLFQESESSQGAHTNHETFYNAWESKLFWGGLALTLSCSALFIFTVVSVASPWLLHALPNM